MNDTDRNMNKKKTHQTNERMNERTKTLAHTHTLTEKDHDETIPPN